MRLDNSDIIDRLALKIMGNYDKMKIVNLCRDHVKDTKRQKNLTFSTQFRQNHEEITTLSASRDFPISKMKEVKNSYRISDKNMNKYETWQHCKLSDFLSLRTMRIHAN